MGWPYSSGTRRRLARVPRRRTGLPVRALPARAQHRGALHWKKNHERSVL